MDCEDPLTGESPRLFHNANRQQQQPVDSFGYHSNSCDCDSCRKQDRIYAENKDFRHRAFRDNDVDDEQPVVLPYETEGMADLRGRLLTAGFSHASVDIFKSCLVALERQGFTLNRKT